MDKDLARVGIVGGGSIYPLVWNILLAARNEGYAGTMTTMGVKSEPAVQALLNIPQTWAVASIVPLGVPLKQLTKLRRKSVEEVLVRDRWDGADSAL
jgi:nitroreductase